MTPQEAIGILEKSADASRSEFQTALEVAIKSTKKQIPDSAVNGKFRKECPSCNKGLEYGSPTCECGQRLKW